ncbi:hypothetical protein C8J56DRAFT_1159889 [Mycena floridula]|nr:hypothetical protein C8J56DRAFT_1159889 [Mycena floridula]
MSSCTGACKNCCSLQSPEVFESLAASRHDELFSLLRNNASSINDITDSSASSLVQKDLERCVAQIKQCEREKRRLDGMLLFLSNQKKALGRLQENCRSLSAPVRKVPTENYTKVEGFQVAAVSHHWRTVALSTRAMWSDITLHNIPEQSQQLVVLDKLLELSDRHLLNIRVTSSKMDRPISTRLLPQSHRWVRVSLFRPYPVLLDDQATLSLSNIEYLESSVNFSAYGWPAAPKLRTLKVNGAQPEAWNAAGSYSLSANFTLGLTVRHLVLNRLPLNVTLEFISLSPNLISVDIEHCSLETIMNQPLLPCNSTLTTLSMVGCSSSVVEALFRQLQPGSRLTSMSVDCTEITGDGTSSFRFPHLAFATMIRRTSAKLQSLTLKEFTVSDPGIVQILEVIPSLTTLSIQAISKRILQSSTMIRMNANREPFTHLLVPNLVDLTLALDGTFSVSIRPFVEMIQSRWVFSGTEPSRRPLSGLKSVNVSVKCRLEDTELGPLKVLKGAGMDITLNDQRGIISLDVENDEYDF